MILYQNPYVKLEYLASEGILVQRWNGFATSDSFRQGIDKSLELVKEKKIKGIISDTRNQSVVKGEDTQYATASLPKLFLAGMKAMAFVMPSSVFTQMSLNKFASDNPMNVDTVRFFEDFGKAQDWVSKHV